MGAALELAAVAGLGSRRAADARAAADLRLADHVGDEVAAALTLTCRAADRLVSLAAAVIRLPAVAAALAAGRIDLPKAIIFTDELAGLGDVEAAAVAALVAADAPGLTTGQLRGVLHRAVLALDPDAARKRRERAQRDARVECWTEPAGTWSLAGRDLPPAAVLAADQHIDTAARDLKAAGAGGTLEQLRAAVFLALLTSRPLYTLLPGQDAGLPGQDAGAGGHCGDDGDGPGNGPAGDDGDRPGGDGGGGPRGPGQRPFAGPFAAPGGTAGGTAAWAGPGGLTGTVNFTVPLTTWLGLAGGPGEAAGYGYLDAAASRDLSTSHHHHPRLPLVPDHHQPRRPRHRARLRQERTTTTRARTTRPCTTRYRASRPAQRSRTARQRPLAHWAQDQLARDRGVRPHS